MRRSLRRVSTSIAAIAALAFTAPVWAGNGVDWRGGGSDGSAVTKAEDAGSSGGSSGSDEEPPVGDEEPPGGEDASGSGVDSQSNDTADANNEDLDDAQSPVDSHETTSNHEYNEDNLGPIALKDLEGSWNLVTGEQDELNDLRMNCLQIQLQIRRDDCMHLPLPGETDPENPENSSTSTGDAAQVSPATVARTAVSEMHLSAPEIASTPNDSDMLGAVGLPVWLWVANPGPTTTGPNSTSATAGDVTVTATAKFSGMSIDMGDGTTIECDGPGTEYPGTGIEESPDCGHVYEQMSDDQPGGLYTVNITAHWAVDWESNTGEGGQIPVDLTTDKQLRIGSYQSVVTDVT